MNGISLKFSIIATNLGVMKCHTFREKCIPEHLEMHKHARNIPFIAVKKSLGPCPTLIKGDKY